MALTSGFFDSVDGDRRYDADQFSSFLDGIVYDGVYGAYGNCFYVMSNESEDLGIIIDTGRAWFNHTWTLNDTYYNLTMPEADLLLDRIDAVVIEVNKEDRQNSFQVVQGTPADSPVRPTLKGRSGEVTEEIYQYAIAYIARPAASTKVTQDQIVYVVDTSETPLCSALALAGIPSGGKIGQVLAKESNDSAAVGWYDLDKLPNEKWYLIDGIQESNVIAAYKFVGQSNYANAMKNVNDGDSYPLSATNRINWTTGTGLQFPSSANAYINNSDLININAQIYSCAFGYTNAGTSCSTGGVAFSKSKYLFHRCTEYLNSEYDRYYYPTCYYNSGRYYGPNSTKSGVLSINFSPAKVYRDGILQSSTKISLGQNYSIRFSPGRIFTTASEGTITPIYLTALIFFNCVLSQTQHQQIAYRINAFN